jgi:hypothetical protein
MFFRISAQVSRDTIREKSRINFCSTRILTDAIKENATNEKYHPDDFRGGLATFTPKIPNSPQGLKIVSQITTFFLPVVQQLFYPPKSQPSQL